MLEAVHLSPGAIGTNVKDGHEIKLEKVEPIKFKCSTCYNHQNYYYGYWSLRNLFEISFFISLLNHFVYWH